MKLSIPTQQLNQLIGKVQHVVPQRPTLPILSNVVLEAANDELVLTATDLTVSIRCSIEAEVLEEGATTLPARRLGQLVRELTAPNVELSTTPHEITTLVAGTSRFKLNGMARSDFPLLPDLSQAQAVLIGQKELKELLYRTSFAVSKEDNLYVLTGMLMQMARGQLLFVGTDGKRLAKAHAQLDVPSDFTAQAIVPLKAIDELFKNLTEEGEVKISWMPDKMAVEMNQTLLVTKLLSGDYPDVSRVIPEHCDLAVSLHREELTALLRQMSLFIADQHHSVRLTLVEGELRLMANTSDIGEGHVTMPVNYHGPRFEVAFNPIFFLDILRHCKEETATLGLTDPYNPGVITDGEVPLSLNAVSPLFILMPMRLSEE